MNKNLEIYEAGREVPDHAKKQFDRGTFKGTDINPMWRIRFLTEQFGPIGFGWRYDVLSERAEKLTDTDTVAVVDINLYIKYQGEWSAPIYGTGGNWLTRWNKKQEKIEINDEGYKMALTDAISVACKMLGIGADVYWEADKTKYTRDDSQLSLTDLEALDDLSLPAALASEPEAHQCQKCKAIISDKVARYSIQKFQRPLCYKCQQAE